MNRLLKRRPTFIDFFSTNCKDSMAKTNVTKNFEIKETIGGKVECKKNQRKTGRCHK